MPDAHTIVNYGDRHRPCVHWLAIAMEPSIQALFLIISFGQPQFMHR